MNLTDRAKNIVLQPKQEWQVIATESATTAQLYTSYVIPLAAIGPIASIIGMSLIGISVPFIGTYQVPIGTAITHSILSYALTLVGIVVLDSINRVITPPRVSIPNDSGVTSSNRTSFTSPVRTPPCIAAPTATTSSGFTPFEGSFPKKSLTNFTTAGILVEPPTRITSSMLAGFRPASFMACSQGGMVDRIN
jgi:hypothetical protein